MIRLGIRCSCRVPPGEHIARLMDHVGAQGEIGGYECTDIGARCGDVLFLP